MKSVRSIVVGVILSACSPAMAFAQTASPPSAHQLELARRVMDDVGGQKTIDQMANTMIGPFITQMAQSQSADVQEKARTIIIPALQATMTRVEPKMFDMVVASYAQNFSEQELADIDAFYQSPSGRAMIAKMPQMMASMMQNMGPLRAEIRQDFSQEVCQRMTCTPAIRAALEGQTPPTH